MLRGNDAETQRIQAQLNQGEKLLWSGQPMSRGRISHSSDIAPFVRSLLWCALMLLIVQLVSRSLFNTHLDFQSVTRRFSLLLPWWVFLSIPIGIYLVCGRFIITDKVHMCTYYVVTNHRILIISTRFLHKVNSWDIRQLSEISLHLESDGSGTITFGHTEKIADSLHPQSLSFEMIEDAQGVYNIIQDAQRAIV